MSKLWAERLTAIGMIVVALFFLTQSVGMPESSGTFPKFTEFVIMLLAVVMIVRSFMTHDKRFEGNVHFDFSYIAMKPFYVMIVACLYGYAVFEVGFYVSSIVFYFLVTYMTGIRAYKVMGAVAVVLFPLLYLFFTIALDAEVPEGFLL